jgi:diguanylate cyclase (GGDEF)-like protein
MTKMRVLICDDSRTISALIMNYVQEDFHEVVLANSGNQALEVLSQQSVDLIIMDVEMPGLNGFEVTQKIRKQYPNWIPIIFLTANNTEEAFARGIDVGGDDYLLKPISPEILKAKIRAMARIDDMRKELVELNQKLEKISNTDSLTNIMNRRGFEDYGKKLWLASRRKSHAMSVLMIDIDYFKKYNDNYGHQKGDESLREVARAISEALVRPLDVVARVGGEEFSVLLADTDEAGANVVAQRILASVQALELEHSVSPVSACMSVSVGVASVNDTKKYEMYELLGVADKALYQSKGNGRNTSSSINVLPRKHIFAVDDDFDILALFRNILGEQWDVFTFNNAQECIDRSREVVPDLMLVDIMMKGMDGYEVARTIRENAATANVPIIFISSISQESLRPRAKELGVNAYLGKPIDIQKLQDKVASFL